ncbi:hypothetical protein H8S90_11080 [Olivibacter sp. SDN3]|uniref:hypothetical protein n=1 Tax=Olivibacter sp. SDN3 TaxID=2764720 RepID=UPI0016511B3F|nr:hypothetical protein [Olivibacter sp. SDN3]QNL52063.1 hypothetical protein H8S90_11080 [Olivibacter sp. SDN3]
MLKKIRFCSLLFGLSVPAVCFGQFVGPFSIGIGGGGTKLYGDLRNKPIDYAGHLEVDYLVSPFTSVGLQGQLGRLKGDDQAGRDALNRYVGANANVKVRVGQFMPQAKNYSLYSLSNKNIWSYLSNLYAGVGIGFIYSDVEAYRGEHPDGGISETFAGEDYSYTTVVPVNVGIDIPFGYSLTGPVWAVNVNFQLGISFGDNLDGYTNSYSNYQDRMMYFSVGVKRSLHPKVK